MKSPQYTQISNEFLDGHMRHLSHCELKVYLAISRKILGWGKCRDVISLSQLENATGSSQTNILRAVESLIEKRMIKKEVKNFKGKPHTYYELLFEDDTPDTESGTSHQIRDEDIYPSHQISGAPLTPDQGSRREDEIQKKFTTDMASDTKEQLVVCYNNNNNVCIAPPPTPVSVVAVVSSSNDILKKKQLLAQNGLKFEDCPELADLPLVQFEMAIAAVEQREKITPPFSRPGMVRTAIRQGWKPTKEAVVKEEKKADNVIDKIRKQCVRLYESYKYLFKEKLKFDIFEDRLVLIANNCTQVVGFLENNCIQQLEKFIEFKLKYRT